MGEPFLLILTGPPGAGKTTVGHRVAAQFSPSSALEADFFWASVVRGMIPPWNAEAESQNEVMLRASLTSAALVASGGYAVVLEGIYRPWYVKLLRKELPAPDFPVFYVVLRPTIDDCLFRAVDRLKEPRHVGALSAERPIRQLYRQFQHLGQSERYVLDSHELTVEETVDHIVEDINGRRSYHLEW